MLTRVSLHVPQCHQVTDSLHLTIHQFVAHQVSTKTSTSTRMVARLVQLVMSAQVMVIVLS